LRLRVVVAGTFALSAALILSPQARPYAMQGVSTSPATGTGIISGRVTAADTGAPLRRAQISLTGSSPRVTRSTGTDDNGRYEFTGLPTASYEITAWKTGYVRAAFGQRGSTEPGRPIPLTSGQTLNTINLTLPRGGVVVATVSDAYGEPLTGVRVDASRYDFVGGTRRLLSIGSTNETNDLGQVRISGLPAGEYYVGVSSGGSTSLGAAGDDRMYTPTFFPGTADFRQAQRVAVAPGTEVDVAFSVVAVRSTTITGAVHRADGSPIAIAPSTTAPTPGERRYSLTLRSTALVGTQPTRAIRTDANGRFSIENVLPGDYVIEGRAQTAATTIDGAGTSHIQLVTAVDSEFARVPLTADGSAILDVDVVMRRAADIRGQLRFDTGKVPGDKSPQDLSVVVSPTGVEQALARGSTIMHDDYSFEIVGGVMTGLLRLQNPAIDWSTKSVVIDGKDVTHTPTAFEPGRSYRNVEVTLTQKRATVNGTVVDSRGRAAADRVVVLFTEERDWWYPRSPVVMTARSDTSGRFTIARLPDGNYLIAALETFPAGAEQDADTLATLVPRTTRVTLGEGETRTITVTSEDVR
jgi:hypothetical protein